MNVQHMRRAARRAGECRENCPVCNEVVVSGSACIRCASKNGAGAIWHG